MHWGLALLFIIAIDPLHRLLEQATTEGILKPLPGSLARLRVSLYADDAIVFANPKRQEIDTLLELLRLFGDSTGLHVSLPKSSVVPIRCDDIDLALVMENFGGHAADFPIRYLGLPVILGRTRLVHL